MLEGSIGEEPIDTSSQQPIVCKTLIEKVDNITGEVVEEKGEKEEIKEEKEEAVIKDKEEEIKESEEGLKEKEGEPKEGEPREEKPKVEKNEEDENISVVESEKIIIENKDNEKIIENKEIKKTKKKCHKCRHKIKKQALGVISSTISNSNATSAAVSLGGGSELTDAGTSACDDQPKPLLPPNFTLPIDDEVINDGSYKYSKDTSPKSLDKNRDQESETIQESSRKKHKHKHKSKRSQSTRSPDRGSSYYHTTATTHYGSSRHENGKPACDRQRESSSYSIGRSSSQYYRHKRSEHRDYARSYRRSSPNQRHSPSRSPHPIENGKSSKRRYRSRSRDGRSMREENHSHISAKRRVVDSRSTLDRRNTRLRESNSNLKHRVTISPDFGDYPSESKRKSSSGTNGDKHVNNDRDRDRKSSHSKPGSPPKRDVRLVSKSRTEFDIFWDESLSDGKKGSVIDASKDDPAGSRKSTSPYNSRSEPSFACVSPKDSPRTPPSDHFSEKDPGYLSPDKIPTPTQDESIENNEFSNNDSPGVQRITSLNIKSDNPDAYDPEVPLESPEINPSLSLESSESPYEPLDKIDKKSPRTEKARSPSLSHMPLSSANVSRPKTPTSESRTSRSPPSPSPPRQSGPNFSSPSSHRISSVLPSKSHATTAFTKSSPKNSLINSSKPPVPGSLLDQIQQTLNLSKRNLSSSSFSKTSRSQSSSSPSFNSNSHHQSHHPNSSSSSTVSSSKPFPDEKNSEVQQTITPSANVSSTTMSATLKTLLDSLIKAAQQQRQPQRGKNSVVVDASNIFKKPAPVGEKDSLCRKPSPHSSNLSHRHNHHHHSVKTTVVNKTVSNSAAGHHIQGSTAAPNLGPRRTLSDLAVLDDVPSSAVELQVKEKYLKKLNRQERVIEEVKMVSKPYYQRKDITKEEYKEIMRKAVPKICHSRSGEINPQKIRLLVEGYVMKFKHARKKNKAHTAIK
ncbi:uncharacterized protein LOC141856368 [Brevipalpus obovatus]|uniref:uncharacterized protein LOC141856368 n=1 Tax=Brevipalpus obovatus TaxID=246614 RepID=UPI003D9EE947